MNKNNADGRDDRSSLPGLSGASRKSRASSLADDLEMELEDARQQGVFGIFRMRYEAWVDERLKGAYQRKLNARQELVAAKTKTTRVEQELSEAVHDGTKQDVRQGIEAAQLEHLRSLSEEAYNPQIASRIVPQLVGSPGPEIVPASVSYGSVGTPMTNHISDEEVNQEALKLLMKLTGGVLKDSDRLDLERRYPPLVAQEIQRRAAELAESAL